MDYVFIVKWDSSVVYFEYIGTEIEALISAKIFTACLTGANTFSTINIFINMGNYLFDSVIFRFRTPFSKSTLAVNGSPKVLDPPKILLNLK